MLEEGEQAAGTHGEGARDQDGDQGAGSAELRQRFPDAKWCITCNSVKLAARSHKSRAKKHMLRELTEKELADHLDAKRQASQTGAVATSDMPAPSPVAADAVVSAGSGAYFLEFGKHKRKDWDHVLRVDRAYIDWAVTSKLCLQ